MSRDLPPVTILTSAIGLGVYIPALLIERQLKRFQCPAEVEVLEGYYTAERQLAHLAHKEAHHENFALAQMAHRMVRDVQDCLDGDRIRLLIERWVKQRREHFIVWSGFWLPIIEQYRRLIGGGRLNVDCCRIDAEISASFRIYPNLLANGNPIWLWNWAEKKIVYQISATDAVPVPFAQREDRLVAHGGGWGIGAYQSKAVELERTPYALDVVIHDLHEARRKRPADRCYMVDPAWRPWTTLAGRGREFPPMAEAVDSSRLIYPRNADVHGLYENIRRSKAIVSKPGGCTLMDSLSSATPVVFLEPYGYAEKSNAEIWEYLGFGISYPAWRATGYDVSVLDSLHSNLLASTRTGMDYPRAYARRVLQERRG